MKKYLKYIFIFVILALIGFYFYKNSQEIKSKFNWIFESQEEEIALPDLSNEEIEENIVKIENQNKIDSTNNLNNEVVVEQDLNISE